MYLGGIFLNKMYNCCTLEIPEPDYPSS